MITSELAARQKDLSRSIYISLISGKVGEDMLLRNQISEMRDVLDEIERLLVLEQSGYTIKSSDLHGLAKYEAQS